MAEKWTNTSSPFSRWIKPNPLAALNHFTLPVSFIFLSFFLCDRLPARIERERYSRDGTRTSKYVPTDSTACKGCKSLKRYHVCVDGYNWQFTRDTSRPQKEEALAAIGQRRSQRKPLASNPP